MFKLFDNISQDEPSEGPRKASGPISPVEDRPASPSKGLSGAKGAGGSKEPGPPERFHENSEPEEGQASQTPETQERLRSISKGQCMIRYCGWDWSLIVSLDEFEDIQDLIDRLITQLHLKVEEQDQALFYHDHGPEKCTEMRQLSETPLELLRDANIDVHASQARTVVARCAEDVQSAGTPSTTVDE
ncbi:hypothetical protein KC318_g6448 [Hortaea werneckii]|nr:hypothetical protein KC334_g6645 [Hortaea werneckii]KAI7006395.1 hypothetical protein KC355_g7763 [Hortaea werneckii]KAI7198472.1 hypothetical protein KC324_g3760 [Hortaea werneckii]KAI7585696.1 hypothetical protein KC316_g6030 [Hortaea werneckii]KAI7666525.1 hypothetical protein KC318_g6448 [Hortaea werneckii]